MLVENLPNVVKNGLLFHEVVDFDGQVSMVRIELSYLVMQIAVIGTVVELQATWHFVLSEVDNFASEIGGVLDGWIWRGDRVGEWNESRKC